MALLEKQHRASNDVLTVLCQGIQGYGLLSSSTKRDILFKIEYYIINTRVAQYNGALLFNSFEKWR